MGVSKEDKVLEILENYLTSVDLYEGNLLEALGYTLHHLEGKEYAITLSIAMNLIENEKVRNVYTPNEKEQEEWNFWKKKKEILLLKYGVKPDMLKKVIEPILTAYQDEIVKNIKRE